ncbi:hypothetical protein ACJX0J_012895, partial [Zea mays]
GMPLRSWSYLAGMCVNLWHKLRYFLHVKLPIIHIYIHVFINWSGMIVCFGSYTGHMFLLTFHEKRFGMQGLKPSFGWEVVKCEGTFAVTERFLDRPFFSFPLHAIIC